MISVVLGSVLVARVCLFRLCGVMVGACGGRCAGGGARGVDDVWIGRMEVEVDGEEVGVVIASVRCDSIYEVIEV